MANNTGDDSVTVTESKAAESETVTVSDSQIPPVSETPSMLSRESLTRTERHLIALLYALWETMGVQKRIIRMD